MTPRWSYGVTTVPSRQNDLLPRTLDSLARAGFDRPRLFVDGPVPDFGAWTRGLSVTHRNPRIGAWANWVLALYELHVRDPLAERVAIFQDDVVACRDLRAYLDACRYPDGTDGRPPGYWSLYASLNAEEAIYDRGVFCGWIEGPEMVNQVPNDGLQCGRGALGLVFNREAVIALLQSPSLAAKPSSTDRPDHCIDGAVVTAMNLHRHDPATGRTWRWGWREYVHGPSLLWHAGRRSTVKEGKEWKTEATSFPGEGWSALEMLQRNPQPTG